MNLNMLPNISYSMCLNKEYPDTEKALDLEEKQY